MLEYSIQAIESLAVLGGARLQIVARFCCSEYTLLIAALFVASRCAALCIL